MLFLRLVVDDGLGQASRNPLSLFCAARQAASLGVRIRLSPPISSGNCDTVPRSPLLSPDHPCPQITPVPRSPLLSPDHPVPRSPKHRNCRS
jgi:hypothetical protein